MFQETGVPLVALVGNKADTADLQAVAAQRSVPQAAPELQSCCCVSYPAVSAKTGHNVQLMAASISAQLAGVPLQQQLPLPPADAQGIEPEAAAGRHSQEHARHQPCTRLLRRVLRRVMRCCSCCAR
jgi:50S ribosomal subunit-associated GTPase HflX